jgi:hypothetical protein
LTSFIDKKHIPKSYGGELEWKWGEMPALDPVINDRLTWESNLKTTPKGPVYFRPADGNRLECISMGSVKQVERHEKIFSIDRRYQGMLPAIPDTSPDAKKKSIAPVVAPGETSGKPEVTTGVETHLTEAKTDPETPAEPAQPPQEVLTKEPIITEVQGVQNLSIADDEAKKADAAVTEKVAVADTPKQAVIT